MKSFLHYLWRGLLVVLCGVFLGVFIFAAYQLYNTFNGYRQASKEYAAGNGSKKNRTIQITMISRLVILR